MNPARHFFCLGETQFKLEKKKVMEIAPRYVGDENGEPTEFGKKYAELPDREEELDAIIEDLAEDLQNTVDNPQVVQKYQKVT